MRVSSRYTPAEAYPLDNNLGDEVKEVGLSFSNGTVSVARYELFQNVPNPFENVTQVGFFLPEASSVKLTVSDAMGKTLRIYEGNYERGKHHINLKSDDLGYPTGVLFLYHRN